MYTFKKEERLCNKKLIEKLYHNGSSFLCYPFKVAWLLIDDPAPYPAQVVFSVSKKRFKKAVDRNLIKRRMREVYRLNKQLNLYAVLTENNKCIALSLAYIGKEITEYDFMHKKMLKLLAQIGEEVQK